MKITIIEQQCPASKAWTLTSPQLSGLLISHADRSVAWSDIPESVEMLCELNKQSLPETDERELQAAQDEVAECKRAAAHNADVYKEEISDLQAELEKCQLEQIELIANHNHLMIDRDAELAEARRDAERLDWFERTSHEGHAYNLVYDDNGKWAISGSGTQPIPPEDGFTDEVDIICFVEPDAWRDSIREAIDAAEAMAAGATRAMRCES